MEARATARGVRTSARKMRLVMDLIRGKRVNDAYSILKFSKKAVTTPINKLLRSAVANARQKADTQGVFLDEDDLVIREAFVNEGPTQKRFSPRAMGRATPILKRTSHATIIVDRKE